MSFELLDFQRDAVEQLRGAGVDWLEGVRQNGPPATVDRDPIPLLGQLQAITGAGKTPILAAVAAGIGPAIIFWTTKSRIVVQQTVEKLRTVYAPLLPDDVVILEDLPSPAQWHDMFDSDSGLTIWVRTVASWNEPETERRGDDDARLSLHRPAADLTGDDRTLWEHLADPGERERPLWVVYDEGHGQTAVQLDQLLELKPIGIFAASGTPVVTGRWAGLAEQIQSSRVWGPIYERGQVKVPTGEVARAGLLKNRVVVHDLNIEDTGRVEIVFKKFQQLDRIARRASAGLTPRAVYVVERSNLPRGQAGEPPPTTIWRILTERCGVPANEIAVATDTKDLPKEAEQVTDFAALKPQHRHVIFNKKLEEGWDNPEAYIAYFDDETNSARRIRQLIGRVVRQPDGRHRAKPELNTAYLFVAAANQRFGAIVRDLQKQLIDNYGEDEFGQATIRVEIAGSERAEIRPRAGLPDLELPIWRLSAAGRIDDLLKKITEEGGRTFSNDQLDAPGEVVAQTFKLSEVERRITQTATKAGVNIRTHNGVFLRDRVSAMSRAARNALKDSSIVGAMYDQRSAYGSYAQRRLADDARGFVDEFVNRVIYVDDWAERRKWTPDEWQPTTGTSIAFDRSIHPEYTDARSVLNADELEFARALDRVADGWWARNFATPAQNGYGLELPIKVGGSNSFYPDFLWWIDGKSWAIDTTGLHILPPKVWGKLLTVPNPSIALVTRGQVSDDFQRTEDSGGWTLIRAATGGVGPRPEHYATLDDLLARVRGG